MEEKMETTKVYWGHVEILRGSVQYGNARGRAKASPHRCGPLVRRGSLPLRYPALSACAN